MIGRNAVGGSLITQLPAYVLGIWITVSLVMAYINIKRLQIDQHRIWMLRAWFVAAYIITLRIIQIAAMHIVSHLGTYYVPTPCQVVDFITAHYAKRPLAATLYPKCQLNPNGIALVKMDFYGEQVDQIGAALNGTFGITSYVALILHAVGVEIYIRLTPAENERLKQVSYEKQLARGMKRPGAAGLTAEVWGDAPLWTTNTLKQERSESGLIAGSESEENKEEAQVEHLV